MERDVIAECIYRMEKLSLSRQCINAFKHGKIWESEGIGALYEINEKEQKIVDDFEEEHKGYKVYHIIHNLYNICGEIMEMYSLFYVNGNDTSEYKQDYEDLDNGIQLVYVYNATDNVLSEFGYITFKKQIGGLVRC